jgi:hypothetical protein
LRNDWKKSYSRQLKTYNYGFSLDEKGIIEEWLNEKAKTARKSKIVFYKSRNEKENDFSGLTKTDTNNLLTALELEVLIISLGNKLKYVFAHGSWPVNRKERRSMVEYP